MKITIESTTRLVAVCTGNGKLSIPARVLWEGVTESGIKVQCLMTRIAVAREDCQGQFRRELDAHRAPQAEPQAFPLRMVI